MREFWILDDEVYSTEQDTGMLRAPEQIHAREVSPDYDKAVQEMYEAIQNFIEQVETHGGDYHPGNAKQFYSALAAFEKVKK